MTRIRCIWVSHTGHWEESYLADAWDEFSVDENPTGWEDAVKKARKSGHVRICVIEVPTDKLESLWVGDVIPGEVNP